MCFVSYRALTPLQYAVKDIPVYKVLKKDLTSPIFNFLYERNKVYYTPLLLSQEEYNLRNKMLGYDGYDVYIIVDEGFHSYDSPKIPHLIRNQVLVNAIIPKGSWYYHNTRRNVYVSDQIRIL